MIQPGNFGFNEAIRWLSLSTLKPPSPVRKTDGTCQWILNDPSFIKWNDRPEENTLWIQGFAGESISIRKVQATCA